MPVDIMIVGAQKSGTTSLLSYLGSHPAIEAQVVREMTWFAHTDRRPFPENLYFGRAAPYGLRLGKLAGLMYKPDAVARLAAHNPQVEVLAVLRDPVHRAYSSFWYSRGRGHDPSAESFEQAFSSAVDRPPDTAATSSIAYLEWSSYEHYEHSVRQLQTRFGAAFNVLIFEEFIADPVGVTRPLLRRWGVDEHGLGAEVPRENASGEVRSPTAARLLRGRAVRGAARLVPAVGRAALRRRYHRANLTTESRPPPMDAETERVLRDVFREPNRRLEELLGRPIEAWSGRSEPGSVHSDSSPADAGG